MIPHVSMREALNDPSLLGHALLGDSWRLHRVVLVAAMGEPLTADELDDFQRVTGREAAPTERVEEALLLIGRRGGKDRAASVLAAYLAAFVDWTPVLAPGERGLVLCIGPDQRQAQITMDYIGAVFAGSPVLAPLVVNRTAERIDLAGAIAIEVRAASHRRLRGVTCVAVIATEAAFWYSDDEGVANADAAILAAVRPTLATTRGPLVIITSPHARSGEVWRFFSRHYGPEGDPRLLVVHGSSRTFNPTLPEQVVQRAYERDPSAAAAEYGAEFRSDLSALLAEDAIAAVLPAGVRELPPDPEWARSMREPCAHFDAATGAGEDSAALAIAFTGAPSELALVREWRPPFSPLAVVAEAAATVRRFGLSEVSIDRYAPGLVASLFREYGITCSVAERDTSGAYIELLGLINSQRVRLLDDSVLLAQLRRLERRASGGGRDHVGHPPRAHDDVAAAAAQALAAAAMPRPVLEAGVWSSRHDEEELQGVLRERLRFAAWLEERRFEQSVSDYDADHPAPPGF